MNIHQNATTPRADADATRHPAPAGRSASKNPKRAYIKQAKWAALGLASALVPVLAPSANAFTSADADTLFNAFNNTFYNNVGHGGNYYYRVNTDVAGNTGSGWWTYAEEIEMAEDAYGRTQSASAKNIVSALCNDFIYQYGKLWTTSNNYNDDICWATIALARAYQITGNTTFRDVARSNFDSMYNRAWDTSFRGGGLWWNTDKQSKNACVEGPGAIAAYLIYQNGGGSSYLDKANAIYNWEWNNLYDSAYGAVHDNVNTAGVTSNYVATYNQGTFIGAADYLGHPNDATKTLSYSKQLWSNLLPDSPDGDLAGFNGIFIRWAVKFMKDSGQQGSYLSWFQNNANAAFNVRRSDNLSWKNWDQATPGGKLDAWSVTNSVVALQVIPPDGGSTGGGGIAGTHSIINVQNGEAVDNASSNTQNAGIILWANNGGNAQKWNFTQNSDTSWNIVSVFSGQALNDGNSSANGAQMIQYGANSNDNNQRWWVDKQSDGTYKIWNKVNSKSLDSGNKSGNNLPLIQWDYNGGSQQRWNLQ